MKHYYYLSIGSNIQPERNAVKIITMLVEAFGPLVMYPFYYTEPEIIKSENVFLNSLAVILVALSKKEVKDQLNFIETHLGRDRSDPERGEKDRCADIDILSMENHFSEQIFSRCKAPYVSGLLASNTSSADLSRYGLPATEGATTVDFDTRTSHIRILDNAADRLEYWQESALSLE